MLQREVSAHLGRGLRAAPGPPRPLAPWDPTLLLSRADPEPRARKTLALLKEKMEDKRIARA